MGYGLYNLEDGYGDRGYEVPDVCTHPGCEAAIDRGMAYLCYGCTEYFCEKHLFVSDVQEECFAGKSAQCCKTCCKEASDSENVSSP
jgi:hypothetical protein